LRFSRLLSIGLSTALLVAATALPAAAAPGDHRGESHAEGFALRLPMSPVGEVLGGASRTVVSHAPLAEASAAGFSLVDESSTEAVVTTDGEAVTDGESCGSAGLPAELQSILAVACSTSHAAITGGFPTASAEATGAELEVTGADLQGLLDALLVGLDEDAIGEALAAVETEVLSPLRAALAEACLAGSEELQPVFDGAGELLAEVERGLEENLPIDVTTLDPSNACVVLLDLTGNPPIIGSPADVIATLRARLDAALSEAVIVAATLGASDSAAQTTAAEVVADAAATGVDVRLPALDLAGDLVTALTGLVDEFLTEVVARVAEVESPDLGVPPASELVDTLRDALPAEVVALLEDTEPLLTITGGQSDATVVLDRSTGETAPTGSQAPLQLTLSAAFEAFLETLLGGQDVPNPISVPEGDSVTIAEGTPLESRFAVGAVTIEDVERDGMTGQRVLAEGVDITLLAGLEGGIGLGVAGATAEVVGEAGAPSVPAAPALPTTGGGLALLGLVSLGGALALGHRRD
jgi:hypothetical protein